MSDEELHITIRRIAMELRWRSTSLQDLIPLMLKAADRIEELEKQLENR